MRAAFDREKLSRIRNYSAAAKLFQQGSPMFLPTRRPDLHLADARIDERITPDTKISQMVSSRKDGDLFETYATKILLAENIPIFIAFCGAKRCGLRNLAERCAVAEIADS